MIPKLVADADGFETEKNLDGGGLPVAAAIDIGSNSIKMTVARADGNGGIDQIDWASDAVLLGRGLETTGRLDPERMDAALATLARFHTQAKELGARDIVAIATEAARAAENGAEFLDRVRAETGIDVRVIDGQEEAALTFRGLAATDDVSGRVIVADIGGGSTEIIVASDGEIASAVSTVLGSGRLTDRFVTSDPPLPEAIAECEREAREIVGRAVGETGYAVGAEARLLVLGGTGEYLARLVGAEREITPGAVREVLDRLLGAPAAQLAEELAIPEARARVLPAGAAIVLALATEFVPARIEIARSGIRAGLLLDLLSAKVTTRDDPEPPVETDATYVSAKTPSTERESRSKPRGRESQRFRDAMRSLIAERWEVVWKTIPAAIDGTDIEGVHDVRVASRRLRAAMDIAAACFPAKWYAPLHRAAKEITSALGEVRDRDVLLEALRADRAAAPAAEQRGIDRLIDRIDTERIAARVEMERFLVAMDQGPLRHEVARRFGARANSDTRDGSRS